MGNDKVDLTEDGYRCGESHPQARLTWNDVENIRALREEHGLTYRELADKFDVTIWCIRDICTYQTWASLPAKTKQLLKKLTGDDNGPGK